MFDFESLFGVYSVFFSYAFRFWWVWLAPTLATLFIVVFLSWRQEVYRRRIEWTLLELRLPREIEKSPKAMEQFFAALHTIRNQPGDFLEKYRDGEVTLWFSFEIVSIEGDIHMYIRTPSKHKRILVANLYANYPTLELEEVPDYVDKFPETVHGIYQKGMDVWGAELALEKEDAYPIRTYLQFENIEEAMSLDPIAGILEILSKIVPGENLLLQILIRPALPDWKEKGQKIVEELKKMGNKKIAGPLGEYEDRPIRTPGETDFLKAVEENISKPGFETTIRYVYIADNTIMNKEFARRSVMAAFNQYSAPTLNKFIRNNKVTTDVKWTYWPHLFSETRLESRKQSIYHNYRVRMMPQEPIAKRVFVLNTQELATIYHPPTHIVLTGQLLERVPSKKLGPPLGLPIFQDTDTNIKDS